MVNSDCLAERLAIEQIDKNTYRSKCLPLRMGNNAPISYGGFQLGIALNAAARTVKSNHYLYSATGYYLGPVSTDSTITCLVEDIRSTRTFSTRQIRVQQGGINRLLVTADFRTAEEALLEFTPTTFRQYTSFDNCKTGEENIQHLLKQGIITDQQAKLQDKFFASGGAYWDVRYTPEGIFGQNLTGIAKDVVTTQDGQPLSDKTTGEWYRIKRDLGDEDQMAALGFLMDAALSFVPLSFNHMFLDDAGACSSLDFALRVFSNSINMNDWHLVEKRPVCGSVGATYSTANMFDTNGKLIAQMSQQSILRPKPSKTKGKL